jgi:hypothetical protein
MCACVFVTTETLHHVPGVFQQPERGAISVSGILISELRKLRHRVPLCA